MSCVLHPLLSRQAGHVEAEDEDTTRRDDLNGDQTYDHHSLEHTHGRSNGHDASDVNGCRETQPMDASQKIKRSAEPSSALVQWCKALLSDDREGVELPVGTGEEAALLEVIREYRERTREKMRAMEERYQHDLIASEGGVEVKVGGKGKMFRSDVDPVSPEQDVVSKRIKVSICCCSISLSIFICFL